MFLTKSYGTSADDPFYSKQNLDRLRKSINQLESSGGTVHDLDPFFSKENMQRLEDAAKRMDAGRWTLHEVDTYDESMGGF